MAIEEGRTDIAKDQGSGSSSSLGDHLRQIARDRTTCYAVGALFALSIALRLLFIHYARQVPLADARDYVDFARNLANGQGYMQLYQGERVAYRGFTFYAYRTPGYPAVLAAWCSVFGWSAHAAMVINLLADLWTQLCLLLLAHRLAGRTGAILSQGLWATHVFWTTALMSESMLTAFLMTALVSIASGLPQRRKAHALLLGVIVTAGIFVRPIAVCASVAAVILIVISRTSLPRRAALVACLLLPTGIGIGLWAWRNHRIFGEIVPLSTNLGRHNAPSFGIDFNKTYLEMRAQGANEAQVDRRLKEQIAARIREAPGAAIGIYLTRVIRLFSVPPVDFTERWLFWRQRFHGHTSEWIYSLHRALYYLYYPVYALALGGLGWLLVARRRTEGLVLTFFLYVIIHGLVSEGNIRYAAPLFPLATSFASLACVRLAGWARSGQREPVRAAA